MKIQNEILIEFTQFGTKDIIHTFSDLMNRLYSLDFCSIDIWYIDTNKFLGNLEYMKSISSKNEISKSNKFQTADLRNRYTICRGILRILIGKYLNIHPSDIKFSYNDCGKPSVLNVPTNSPFGINVSHSENYCAIAISNHENTGIDIEKINVIKNVHKIANRYFGKEESIFIKSNLSINTFTKFYKIWTRKEAFYKAIGVGILAIEEKGYPPMYKDYSSININVPHLNSNLYWTIRQLSFKENFVGGIVVGTNNSDKKVIINEYNIQSIQ